MGALGEEGEDQAEGRVVVAVAVAVMTARGGMEGCPRLRGGAGVRRLRPATRRTRLGPEIVAVPWEERFQLFLAIGGRSDGLPCRGLTGRWLHSELLLEVLGVKGRES